MHWVMAFRPPLELSCRLFPMPSGSFFADLNTRVQTLAGPNVSKIKYHFYPGVGHRPSWVNRDAATWLHTRLFQRSSGK
jgi:hypothetical protein